METKNIGLRGITVADSKISKVDGQAGALYYRGYNVVDLAVNSTFEETAYLLLYGELPLPDELERFKTELALERDIPDMLLHSMQERPRTALAMDVMQAAASLLSDYDRSLRDDSKELNYTRAIQLIAKFPTIVAAWDRFRKFKQIIKPKAGLTHAANFLYMLHGEEPDPETAADFDKCLILHADHTFNASTFAAREVASTRAHIFASVSAGVGALSGELHGGANSRVMEMLAKIGDPANVDAWVKNELESGGKIFGMGHAVYKTMDPRATVLAPMSERLSRKAGDMKWHDMSVAVMNAAQREFRRLKDADIYPNVDFFSATVYRMMGIDIDLFTPIFAISRVAGWCSHVIEEKFAEAQPKPALYRPRAEYIGNYCGKEGCVYTPMDKR